MIMMGKSIRQIWVKQGVTVPSAYTFIPFNNSSSLHHVYQVLVSIVLLPDNAHVSIASCTEISHGGLEKLVWYI